MIVVLGSNGQVGSAFVRLADDVRGFGRSDFDLSTLDVGGFASMLDDIRPDLVVNCAAYTAVDRAESEEALATTVNGTAVGWIAEACATRGIRFVTYSTDYVFDGTATVPYLEAHPTAPVNAYGRSKLVGERAALEIGGSALVIRTSWVVSGTHPNFVRTMIDLVSGGRNLSVVSDQRGCPTIADDLVVGTLRAVDAGVEGLLHLTNQGETTWFELAQAAVGLAGLDTESVAPCTTADYPTPAPRPAYSVLGSDVALRFGLTPLPTWRDSLEAVVQQQLARGDR